MQQQHKGLDVLWLKSSIFCLWPFYRKKGPILAFLILPREFSFQRSFLSRITAKNFALLLKLRRIFPTRGGVSCGILYLQLNKTNSVFMELIDNPQDSVQDESSFNALLIRFHKVCGHLPFRTITTSSAYAIVSYLFDSMSPSNSLITRTHSNGESTPACGVPLLTHLQIFESPRVELTILLKQVL